MERKKNSFKQIWKAEILFLAGVFICMSRFEQFIYIEFLAHQGWLQNKSYVKTIVRNKIIKDLVTFSIQLYFHFNF